MKNRLFPKLTKEQCRILNEIIWGSEIQVTPEGDHYEYTLVTDQGDTSAVRSDTFNRLKQTGLIKLKYRPSLDVERWG